MIDESVYPDVLPPDEFVTDEEVADYVARICGAWDFGMPPEVGTIELLARYKRIFDMYPLSHSVGYHAFRELYGLSPIEGQVLEAAYERIDRAEGRPPDLTPV